MKSGIAEPTFVALCIWDSPRHEWKWDKFVDALVGAGLPVRKSPDYQIPTFFCTVTT